MVVQIIRKSDDSIMLMVSTGHPKAIGEITKDELILYLNDGSIYTFLFRRLDNLEPSSKSRIHSFILLHDFGSGITFPDIKLSKKAIMDGSDAQKLLFLVDNLDIFDKILDMNNGFLEDKFEIDQYRDIKLDIIYHILNRYLQYEIDNSIQIPDFLTSYDINNNIKNCISIKYSDYYIHIYWKNDPKHHFHFIHNDKTINEEQYLEIEKCINHDGNCDVLLSDYMIYISKAKSARR